MQWTSHVCIFFYIYIKKKHGDTPGILQQSHKLMQRARQACSCMDQLSRSTWITNQNVVSATGLCLEAWVTIANL